MNQQQAQLQHNIDKEVADTLKGMMFPQMHLERGVELLQWINMALLHHAPDAVKCDWETYQAIATKQIEDMSVQEIGIALNAVAMCNAQQLRCISMDAYMDIQTEVRRIADKWKAIVRPISETIKDKHIKAAGIIKPTNGLLK